MYNVLCASCLAVDELADVWLEYVSGISGLVTRAVVTVLLVTKMFVRHKTVHVMNE